MLYSPKALFAETEPRGGNIFFEQTIVSRYYFIYHILAILHGIYSMWQGNNVKNGNHTAEFNM